MQETHEVMIVLMLTILAVYLVYGFGWYVTHWFTRVSSETPSVLVGIRFTTIEFVPKGLVKEAGFFIMFLLCWPFIQLWFENPGPPDPGGQEPIPEIFGEVLYLGGSRAHFSEDQCSISDFRKAA